MLWLIFELNFTLHKYKGYICRNKKKSTYVSMTRLTGFPSTISLQLLLKINLYNWFNPNPRQINLLRLALDCVYQCLSLHFDLKRKGKKHECLPLFESPSMKQKDRNDLFKWSNCNQINTLIGDFRVQKFYVVHWPD